ncbi:MAG: hypothetical protein ACI805_001135, partial [Candidatus Azotimanducaceae bacterium]
MSITEFRPPLGLGHGHIQTILGSSLRKFAAPRRSFGVRASEKEEVFTASDGTQLVAWVSEQAEPAP